MGTLSAAGGVSHLSSSVHHAEPLGVKSEAEADTRADHPGIEFVPGAQHLDAIGAPSVNQAVKALIIARNYMSDDSIDLCLVPSQLEMGPDCLSLEVLKHGKTPDTPAPEDDCFKAAGSTKPHALAGAAAAACACSSEPLPGWRPSVHSSPAPPPP